MSSNTGVCRIFSCYYLVFSCVDNATYVILLLLLEYLIEHGFVVALHDYMVVAYRGGEEVAGSLFVAELYELLGAAEVGITLALNEHAFLGIVTAKTAANLEDGYRTRLHETANSHADARLKVCVKFVVIYHVKWDSAVSKQQFSSLGVDACWVGLESTLASHGLRYLH